ncbi:hypothetical protein Jab_1c04290 [Janthinobacterium sp. HH01]|uniref:hypothetical protein n=1 Tax=Janthinobacterium sp. HH01 TaxID=1198452 RepID=UPI0002AEB87A|nr:hypothetical protein [Janthinobacterium sp. HH01]ELX11841.1 hypothetical protein Jab_1c04290 [Janthinobacterium sp. HH01]
MYGILLSALYTVGGWVFRQVVIKFLVVMAIYVMIASLVNNLAEFMGGSAACCSLSFNPAGLSNVLSLLPNGVWFWLDLFSFTQGACLVVTAMVYRFLIRRIPFVG